MKTKETSTRQQAIAWWKSINGTFEQRDLGSKYYPNRDSLTGREIEQIWLKEMQNQSEERTAEQHSYKPNQKQFKQFDESLFKAYIDKFSDEDKFKAFISNLNELSEEIQFNAFLATLKKMNLDSKTQSNIMTLVALKDI